MKIVVEYRRSFIPRLERIVNSRRQQTRRETGHIMMKEVRRLYAPRRNGRG